MGPETSEVYINGTFLWVYIFFDKISYFTVNSLSTLHSSSFIRFSIFDFREGNVHSDLCLLHR